MNRKWGLGWKLGTCLSARTPTLGHLALARFVLALHTPALLTLLSLYHGRERGGDTLLSLGRAFAHTSTKTSLAFPNHRRDLGLGAHSCGRDTHLEAFFGSDEEHFEGLPTLKGKAMTALLLAPGPLLLGVEDHHGLVQPGVEMQGSLSTLLVAAQQVDMKPGEEGWGVGGGEECSQEP